jgi:glycosyltransferase involved in cell wall biosynthesis
LEAARILRKSVADPFTIMMVGSGELEHELRNYCREHSLNNVVFTGFVNQSDLVDYYSAADVFVLPSEVEPWGLAVNEAMCAGLPIVASREVGCAPDLIQDGVNGYTLPAGDVEGLARALQLLITDKELRLRQGRASLERMEQWGFRSCLDGIRWALGELRS